MKNNVTDDKAGFFEAFNTLKEAIEAIAKYESRDKSEGTYTPNFYSIVSYIPGKYHVHATKFPHWYSLVTNAEIK